MGIWLLIGAAIVIGLVGIGAIYICGFKNYKLVSTNQVGYDPNGYNLMKD